MDRKQLLLEEECRNNEHDGYGDDLHDCHPQNLQMFPEGLYALISCHILTSFVRSH